MLIAALMAFCMMFTACSSSQETTAAPETTEAAKETTAAPATEAPATEAPATEAPVTETPAAEVSSTEAPVTETPAAETPSETASDNGETITITDMTGHEVTIHTPVERVVALSAADCEILYAIGAGDLLVGRGEYCDYPAEVLDLPSVQSGYETNTEQIIALEPQVLFMSAMAQTQEQVASLEAAGVAVVVSDAYTISDVLKSIETIGLVTGHGKEAAKVSDNMKNSLTELSSLANGDRTKTVYFEVSPLEYGLWTAGKGTFMDEVADLLGLKNAFDDVSGWGEISEEQVLERNPDYIVTITMYYGEGPTPEEEIASRPGWDAVKAVQNGKILRLENDELSRPAPRLVDGARLLYEFAFKNDGQ